MLSAVKNDESYFIQWDPESSSDVSIINTRQFNDLERNLYSTITAITLTISFTHFTAAKSHKMNFDGFFTAILKTISGAQVTTQIFVSDLPPSDPPLLGEFELLNIGLITYHPEDRQVNVRKIEEKSKQLDNGIKIELKDKDWVKKFGDLHEKYKKVFSGMDLLKNYTVNRLVGDYRHVNKFIRPTSTTVSPRLESFLDKM